ncbi:hypothetical protein ACFPVT_07025 [Corynebacterium choanae]|uniref:CAP-Gly protein n=1 Tax=Corynebacterium choanae TaxID=1862358 RepID=A0A3G6J7P4_9CORY|nr:hypothetical protein [Corynebacterium choanae]AZA13842.1 hypothetical protein CCHOA_07250 [Corynebacterium choanae]
MATKFYSYLRDEEAGANLSWGAIFAGVVSFVSVFLTLSLIGNAIGLGLLSPASDDVTNGAGIGIIIWTIINFLVSFGIAGFVAGLTSGRVGFVHGFITWATSVLVLVVALSWGTVAAVNTAGSILGSVANVAGKGVSTVAGGAGDLISIGTDKAADSLSNIDTDQATADVKQILKDTDDPKLQPAYLQDQLDAAKDDVADAAKQLATNPQNAEEILKNTGEKLQNRANDLADSVDRDAVAASLQKNTDMTPEEARQAADNAADAYEKSVREIKQGLDNASEQIDELSVQAEQAVDDALQATDDATDAAAKYSLWGFFGLLLALAAAVAGGVSGARVGRKPQVQARA